MSIMYVCQPCQENAPECCGYDDRSEIRVMPDGTWVCENCFDCGDVNDWGVKVEEDEFKPSFSDFVSPPEYLPRKAQTQGPSHE